MKISILVLDLSHNCLGRAYILAKILQRRHDVEIVGPMFGKGIWVPVINDKKVQYKSVKFYNRFISIPKLKELYCKIDGDVIYAVKPLFNSFTIGLIKKFFTKKPLILDIDDWELGFFIDFYKNKKFTDKIFYLLKEPFRFFLKPSDSFLWEIINEKMVRFADKITVSNNFLKERFGGVIIYHGRDTDTLNPERFNKQLFKQKYGINGKIKIAMFFGTPRPHKGVEDLVEAVFLIESKDIILIVVGVNERDQYCKDLIKTAEEKLGERLRMFGLQSFEKIPEFLSLADVIVIPQRGSYSTIGQVPAKVFDAMAMAKAIIATNVGDLPEILDDCGWIVEPGNPEQLSRMIQHVLSNYKKAKEMGIKARQKCIEKYSWDVMEKVLVGVFEKYG